MTSRDLVARHEELARPALDVGLERADLGGVGLLAERGVEVDELLARLRLHGEADLQAAVQVLAWSGRRVSGVRCRARGVGCKVVECRFSKGETEQAAPEISLSYGLLIHPNNFPPP